MKPLHLHKGPDAFYEAQGEIYHILEEEHYPSFILSDIYHKCITTTDHNDEKAEKIEEGNSIFT